MPLSFTFFIIQYYLECANHVSHPVIPEAYAQFLLHIDLYKHPNYGTPLQVENTRGI